MSALQVFSIPELSEIILKYLKESVSDNLCYIAFGLTCKLFYDISREQKWPERIWFYQGYKIDPGNEKLYFTAAARNVKYYINMAQNAQTFSDVGMYNQRASQGFIDILFHNYWKNEYYPIIFKYIKFSNIIIDDSRGYIKDKIDNYFASINIADIFQSLIETDYRGLNVAYMKSTPFYYKTWKNELTEADVYKYHANCNYHDIKCHFCIFYELQQYALLWAGYYYWPLSRNVNFYKLLGNLIEECFIKGDSYPHLCNVHFDVKMSIVARFRTMCEICPKLDEIAQKNANTENIFRNLIALSRPGYSPKFF